MQIWFKSAKLRTWDILQTSVTRTSADSAPKTKCLFAGFDSLRPSQQFFSYVGMGLPGLNQY